LNNQHIQDLYITVEVMALLPTCRPNVNYFL